MKRRTQRRSYKKRRTNRRRQRGGATACKADPAFKYPNTKPDDDCKKLCKSPDGKNPHIFNKITNKTIIEDGRPLIFAIPIDEPDTIYYHPIFGGEGPLYYCDSGEVRAMINHNCLVNDREVITAGEIHLSPDGRLQINNMSGHYLPKQQSLSHVKCLLTEMGFEVEDY